MLPHVSSLIHPITGTNQMEHHLLKPWASRHFCTSTPMKINEESASPLPADDVRDISEIIVATPAKPNRPKPQTAVSARRLSPLFQPRTLQSSRTRILTTLSKSRTLNKTPPPLSKEATINAWAETSHPQTSSNLTKVSRSCSKQRLTYRNLERVANRSPIRVMDGTLNKSWHGHVKRMIMKYMCASSASIAIEDIKMDADIEDMAPLNQSVPIYNSIAASNAHFSRSTDLRQSKRWKNQRGCSLSSRGSGCYREGNTNKSTLNWIIHYESNI